MEGADCSCMTGTKGVCVTLTRDGYTQRDATVRKYNIVVVYKLLSTKAIFITRLPKEVASTYCYIQF